MFLLWQTLRLRIRILPDPGILIGKSSDPELQVESKSDFAQDIQIHNPLFSSVFIDQSNNNSNILKMVFQVRIWSSPGPDPQPSLTLDGSFSDTTTK